MNYFLANGTWHSLQAVKVLLVEILLFCELQMIMVISIYLICPLIVIAVKKKREQLCSLPDLGRIRYICVTLDACT